MMSEFTRKMFADSVSANDNAREAELEAEAAELWSEIEPMLRTHNALLKRIIAIREGSPE